MSVPAKRRTKSSVKRRAANINAQAKAAVKCSNCQASVLSHRACPKCGYFKGEKKIK